MKSVFATIILIGTIGYVDAIAQTSKGSFMFGGSASFVKKQDGVFIQ